MLDQELKEEIIHNIQSGPWFQDIENQLEDPYKVLYEAMSRVMPITEQLVPIYEVQSILAETSPLFVCILENNYELFEHLYQFFKEAWW